MSKLQLLVHTSPNVTGLGLLALRLVAGGFMAIGHGWGKLTGMKPEDFGDPLGIGKGMSYYGAVTSEFVCGLMIAVGLLTRPACVPFIFTMAVAAGVVHAKDPLFMGGGAAKEPALIYLAMALCILLCGPGKFSIDAAVFGKKGG